MTIRTRNIPNKARIPTRILRLPEPAWPCITPRLNPTRVLEAELVLHSAAVGVTIRVIALYGAITIFDVTTRSSVPDIPMTHFDPRAFSSNELRFYNTKSILGGWKLNQIRRL
uniref:Uncharacterized protein n=1 Tax=Panagrellus redivivus TaxID=6233 RepID=A0A7E4W0D9_PANRE